MENYMTLDAKLEVAIEIITAKIADLSNNGVSTEDEKMKNLLKEKKKVYLCDEETINKVIEEYGPEIKQKYEGVKK